MLDLLKAEANVDRNWPTQAEEKPQETEDGKATAMAQKEASKAGKEGPKRTYRMKTDLFLARDWLL